MLVMKKKKTDSLLKAVGSEANYKYIRAAPVLMTKLEDYTDAIGKCQFLKSRSNFRWLFDTFSQYFSGLVDVFEVRMVGLTYLFKSASSISKRRWISKFEEIQKRLRDQQTNRYTLSSEQ
jgi:hypothetical protein